MVTYENKIKKESIIKTMPAWCPFMCLENDDGESSCNTSADFSDDAVSDKNPRNKYWWVSNQTGISLGCTPKGPYWGKQCFSPVGVVRSSGQQFAWQDNVLSHFPKFRSPNSNAKGFVSNATCCYSAKATQGVAEERLEGNTSSDIYTGSRNSQCGDGNWSNDKTMRWDTYTGYEGQMQLTNIQPGDHPSGNNSGITWCSGRLDEKVQPWRPPPAPPASRAAPPPSCPKWCYPLSPSCSDCFQAPSSPPPPPAPYHPNDFGPQNSPSCENLVSCDGMLHKNYKNNLNYSSWNWTHPDGKGGWPQEHPVEYNKKVFATGRKQLININNQMCSGGTTPDTFYGFSVTNVGVGICNQPTNMNFRSDDENFKNWCGGDDDTTACNSKDYKKMGQLLCRYRNGLVPCIPSHLIGQPQYSNTFLRYGGDPSKGGLGGWNDLWDSDRESVLTKSAGEGGAHGTIPKYFRPINQDLKNLSDGGQSLNYKNIKKCYENISPSAKDNNTRNGDNITKTPTINTKKSCLDPFSGKPLHPSPSAPENYDQCKWSLADPNNSRYCNIYRNNTISTGTLLNNQNSFARDFNAVISSSDCGGMGETEAYSAKQAMGASGGAFAATTQFTENPSEPGPKTSTSLKNYIAPYVKNQKSSTNALQLVPNSIIKLPPHKPWYINNIGVDKNYMKYCINKDGNMCSPAALGTKNCLTCSVSPNPNSYLEALGPPELIRSAPFEGTGEHANGDKIPPKGPWLGRPVVEAAACQTMCPCCKRKACSRDQNSFNSDEPPGRTRSGILHKTPEKNSSRPQYSSDWDSETSMGANCDDCEENFTFGIGWLNPWLLIQMWKNEYTIKFRRVYPKNILENFSKPIAKWMDKFCSIADFPTCAKKNELASYNVCGPWFPIYTKEQYETWNSIAREMYLAWLKHSSVNTCWDASCLLSLNRESAINAMQYRYDHGVYIPSPSPSGASAGKKLCEEWAADGVDCKNISNEGGEWLPLNCQKIKTYRNKDKKKLQQLLGSKYVDDYVKFCDYFDDSGVIIKHKAASDIVRRTCTQNCAKIPPGYPSANFWTSYGNTSYTSDKAKSLSDEIHVSQPDVCFSKDEDNSSGDWGAGHSEYRCCGGQCGCGAKALLPGTKDNLDSQPEFSTSTHPSDWVDPWVGWYPDTVSGSHGIINIQCTNCGEIGLHGGHGDKAGRKRFAEAFRTAMAADQAENSDDSSGDEGACFIRDNKQMDRKGWGRCDPTLCGADGCGAGGRTAMESKRDGLDEQPDDINSATMACAQKLYIGNYGDEKKYIPDNHVESSGMLLQKFFAGGYPGGLDSMLLVVWGDLWVKDLMRWRPDCYTNCPADDAPGDDDGDGAGYWRGWGENVGYSNMPNGDYGWFKRAGTRAGAGGNGSYKYTDSNIASETWLDCGGDGESSRICQRNRGLFIKYGTDLFETITDTIMYIAPLTGLIAKQFRPDTTSQVMISLYSIIGAILQYAPSGNEYDQIFRPRFYGCPPQSNEARWAYNGCCSGAIFQFPSYNSNFGLCTEQFGGTETYRTQFEAQQWSKSGWFNEWSDAPVSTGDKMPAWKLVQFDPYKNMYTKNIFANKNIYIQTSVGPPSEWPGRDGKIKIIPSTRHNCDKVPLWVDCSTDYCLLASASGGSNTNWPSRSNSLKPTKAWGGNTGGNAHSCAKNCDKTTDESSQTHGPPTLKIGGVKLTVVTGNNTNIDGYDTRYLSTIDAFNTYLGEAGGMCRWNPANNGAISSEGKVGAAALPGINARGSDRPSTCDGEVSKIIDPYIKNSHGNYCGCESNHNCNPDYSVPGGCNYSHSQPKDNDDLCTPLNQKYRACPRNGMNVINGIQPPEGSIYGGCWENLCKKCPIWKEIGDFDTDYEGSGCPYFVGGCWPSKSEYFSKNNTLSSPRNWSPVSAPGRDVRTGELYDPSDPSIEDMLKSSEKQYDLICNIDEIQGGSSKEKDGTNFGCPSNSKSPRQFDTCLQGLCGLGGQSDDTNSEFYYKNGVFLCEDAGRTEIPNFDNTPLQGLTPKDLKSSCVYGMPGNDSSEKLTPKFLQSPSGPPKLDPSFGRLELDPIAPIESALGSIGGPDNLRTVTTSQVSATSAV